MVGTSNESLPESWPLVKGPASTLMEQELRCIMNKQLNMVVILPSAQIRWIYLILSILWYNIMFDDVSTCSCRFYHCRCFFPWIMGFSVQKANALRGWNKNRPCFPRAHFFSSHQLEQIQHAESLVRSCWHRHTDSSTPRWTKGFELFQT